MPKRVMSLSVPIMIGSFAFLAASSGHFESSALAQAGGGTKVYATTGTDTMDVRIFTEKTGTLAASGSLGTARSEPFPTATPQNKQIGCWIDAGYTGGSFTCLAIVNGQSLQCTSPLNAPPSAVGSVPWGSGFAQGISTLNGDSFIEFITDMIPGIPGVGGGCIGLHIDNGSKYYPRLP
jgi:hypothetical protein